MDKLISFRDEGDQRIVLEVRHSIAHLTGPPVEPEHQLGLLCEALDRAIEEMLTAGAERSDLFLHLSLDARREFEALSTARDRTHRTKYRGITVRRWEPWPFEVFQLIHAVRPSWADKVIGMAVATEPKS